MTAIVGRAPLVAAVVLLVGAAAAAAVVVTPTSSGSCACACARHARSMSDCETTAAVKRGLADLEYRAGRFYDAERVLRSAAACEPAPIAERFHVVASFYHQLGHAYHLAMADPVTGETEVQLQWALDLDGMLGGAFEHELRSRMLEVQGILGYE